MNGDLGFACCGNTDKHVVIESRKIRTIVRGPDVLGSGSDRKCRRPPGWTHVVVGG